MCDCGWTGVGRDLAVEPFRDLFEIHCPRCDRKFATISYPDQVETAEAAAQGNVEAIDELPKFNAYEQTQLELAPITELECHPLIAVHGDDPLPLTVHSKLLQIESRKIHVPDRLR